MAEAAIPPANSDRVVRISAQPAALDINLDQTAILVVDMQNDFGAEGGMFDRAGIDLSSIRRAIDPTARVLDTARNAGLPVIYLKMAFAPDFLRSVLLRSA